MPPSLRRRIFYRLIWNSSLRKSTFLLSYRYITRAAIAAQRLRNGRLTPSNHFASDPLLMERATHALDQGIYIAPFDSAQVAESVTTNLQALTTQATANHRLKIMPLGDSITSGVIGVNEQDSGGYRPELWNKLVVDGLPVELVGSISNGPVGFPNQHEGHPGWTIGQISASVDEWLQTYQPDLILLMIGTKDTIKRPFKTIVKDLGALIDQMTTQLPNAQLLVASVPPVHPAVKSLRRVIRVLYFNEAIPGVVEAKTAEGKKVHFVDMRSLTVDDLMSSVSLELDSGVHPSPEGYRKIARFWHAAVLRVVNNLQRMPVSR